MDKIVSAFNQQTFHRLIQVCEIPVCVILVSRNDPRVVTHPDCVPELLETPLSSLVHIVEQTCAVAMAKLPTRYPLRQTVVQVLKVRELVVVHEDVFLPSQGGQQQEITEV